MTISEKKAPPLCLCSETNSSQSIEPLSKKKNRSWQSCCCCEKTYCLLEKAKPFSGSWLPWKAHCELEPGSLATRAPRTCRGRPRSAGLPPLGLVAIPLETRAAGVSWVMRRDAVSCEPCWPGGGFVISWVVRVYIFPSFSRIFFWKWVFGVLATVHPIKQRAKYYA